ncbi:MAG: ApaG domain, partial [Candidatus Sedimenticola sp. PURPLELP]
GVVGEQPYLRPGENFRYTSGTSLETPVGTMQGSYQMRNEAGEFFDAPIAPFSLARPNSLN